MLQALTAGTDPTTGEVFPADSPYNQPQIIKAIFFAINQLEALAEKGNQGISWSDEEEVVMLAEPFNEGININELARLHSCSHGAIKARLIKF